MLDNTGLWGLMKIKGECVEYFSEVQVEVGNQAALSTRDNALLRSKKTLAFPQPL